VEILNKHPSLIIFDGVCNLCCGSVQFLIKLDKKAIFKFASLQSEAGKTVTNEFQLVPNAMETIIFIKGKQYFTHSDAVLEILWDLGGIWKVVRVFKLIPKLIRNYIYTQIAKRRYAIFGKRTSCLIPNPSLQKRFLL